MNVLNQVFDRVGLHSVMGLDPRQLLTPVFNFAQDRTPVVRQKTSAIRVLCYELTELLLVHFTQNFI